MMELDQKWGAAKQKEAKRLVEQEKMSWADAEKKAQGEARWLRQKEEEKISLQEQMSEAEAEKRHALAISASEQEMVKAGAVSSDAAATLATGDAFANGAVPLEMQRAVGMGEFDAFAGDYSDVDALIPGLKPDVEKEAKAERMAKAEKKAVQAQWRAKDADVRDVRAEYVKWMRANGKKAPARAARKKHPDASQDAKPLSGNALAEAEQDKKKAQGEFERWKKENNVAGNSDDGDEGDASASASAEASADYGAVATPSSDSVSGANGGGVPTLVDPEEVAEAEARAARRRTSSFFGRRMRTSSGRGVEEGEREAGLRRGRGESRAHLRGRPDHDPQAEEEAKAALEEEQMSDEYKQWTATNLRPRAEGGQGGAWRLFARVRRRRRGSRPRGARGRGAWPWPSSTPEGHRLNCATRAVPRDARARARRARRAGRHSRRDAGCAR